MKERIEKLMSWLTGTHSSLKFALLVFGWTLACGLLIQLVLLPHVFPQLQAGQGLLRGTDAGKFHRIMLALSDSIKQEGWGAWRLYPRGQAVAGIGAIFYVLIAPEPWALLPWNALLHGLAAFFMVELGRLIFKDNKLALASALPLAFFPSAFTWTAQMHNENYTVLGSLMALYACALVLNTNEKVKIWKRLSALLIMPIGLGLIFMVREWMFQIIGLGSAITLALMAVLLVLGDIFRRQKFGNLLISHMPALLMSICVAGMVVVFSDIEILVEQENVIDPVPVEVILEKPQGIHAYEWQNTQILPATVDEKLKEMAYIRTRILKLYAHGHTNFDENVGLHSAADMLAYTPRAAAMGMLAPFPDMWFSRSEKATSGLTRAGASVEMMLAYAMMPGLLYALYVERGNARMWAVLMLCAGVMTVMAIGMPNLGTIYRFRYPFFCTLVGLGGEGWLNFARKKFGR